ncbi:hypothetical protein QQX98_011272 [Neonectria punicea]|uniref:DUF7656 domain-containing protein n=1 Tax=Neonectria punicea TaxID=979145 RepID=A0ABR1GMF9_9HYPO
MLVHVRNGSLNHDSLRQLCDRINTSDSSPGNASAIAGQELAKLEFVSVAVELGALYIGHNGISPQASIYNRTMPVYIADCDATSVSMDLESPRICQLQDRQEVIPDLLEQNKFLAGIGDARGPAFDKKNTREILDTLGSYDDLHGILILLKSNNARLSATFRFCIKELLTHLHRSAAENGGFGFTNTRISNYAPGDTFGPLKALLQEHSEIGLALSTHTTYYFDSGGFRYLAAYKNDTHLPNEEDFRRS